MKNSTWAVAVRVFLVFCIAWSISMMYYVNIVQQDYEIFTNPSGPSTSEF